MRIFISYAREDRAAVESLTGDLRGLGHHVWYDGELEGGQHWWDEILRGITESDLYVFALSGPALDSAPCLAELDYARAVRRPLLPVQLQHVPAALLPPVLSEAQFIDYRAADKAALFKLHKAIELVGVAPPLPD